MFHLITQYNPMLPNIKTIFKKYLPVLHSNQEMLRIFPENTINVTYKRSKNLKELISQSLFPKIIKKIIVQLKSVAENVIFVNIS